MPETLQAAARLSEREAPSANVPAEHALLAGWRHGLSVINLRGNGEDPAFRSAVMGVCKLALPVQPGTSLASPVHRIVWVGPDEWFVIGPKGEAAAMVSALRAELAGTHHAVTDVSGGYTVLHLSGQPVRDVLAQGCPLDLHPRVFRSGCSAGSHFFKASMWIWQTEDAPSYEVLVRSSFMGYFWLMLERSTRECGLVTRRFGG